MTNMNNVHHTFPVIDGIDRAMVPDANSPQIATAHKLATARWSRVCPKGFNRSDNTLDVLTVEFA